MSTTDPTNTTTNVQDEPANGLLQDGDVTDDGALDDVRVNPLASRVLEVPKKGRGVFARQALKKGTVVELAPVLVFSKDAYQKMKADDNLLKDYVFSWGKMGEMALSLGLGSLFNHDTSPNVTYELLREKKVIRYTTCKDVEKGEELCIFYGAHVNYDPAPRLAVDNPKDDGLLDFGDLESLIQASSSNLREQSNEVFAPGETNDDLVLFESMPFHKITQFSDVDPPLSLVEFWAIDIPPPLTPEAFKLTRSRPFALSAPSSVEGESESASPFAHLKRVRKNESANTVSILLHPCTTDLSVVEETISASPLVGNSVYKLKVPAAPARSKEQWVDWGKIWPMGFLDRKRERDRTFGWKRGRVEWCRDMMKRVMELAVEAENEGEVPIACLVTDPWDDSIHCFPDNVPSIVAVGKDTRKSTGNTLCHSFSNVIDAVAALDRNGLRVTPSKSNTPMGSSTPFAGTSAKGDGSGATTPTADVPKIPYLLTTLTVFTSHEPCIYCSMALLHSRISCLLYRVQSVGSGGCGTVLSVHEDGGLNHKYEVWRWREGGELESNEWDA
ncbi:cytidine deaminase-like protein [Atractiella rhizophila]|nr:cytidine deaminase-like protein [Atractiella rhizophila]